jgi:hypothetical protein
VDAHDAATVDAELTHERFAQLGLRSDDHAYILPRNVHVFTGKHFAPHR